jgi:putative intracellular protease/amidase
LSNRNLLFLIVEGFQSANFDRLSICLRNKGANVLVASYNKGDLIKSENQGFNVQSDLSFSEASQGYYDAVIVSDGVTANAIRENVAAIKLIEETWARGNLVVTIGAAAIDLISAGIVDNQIIAGPPNLYEDIRNAGARVSYTPIAISGNIISARGDADLVLLCNDIESYVAKRKEEAA